MSLQDYKIKKQILNSPTKFKSNLENYILGLIEKNNLPFTSQELGDLLLSACRVNEFGILGKGSNFFFIKTKNVLKWLKTKLIPNTVILNIDDEEIVKLLVFCIEITYQMFLGGSKATVTQKGFRERRRTFEAILVDQFVGKLGEVMFKKYIEKIFPAVKIQIDWEISTDIEKFKNDIPNASKKISIKTSNSLSGIWAEAEEDYDYGIMVKCSIPYAPLLQFFIEVCGFWKLLEFAERKLTDNSLLLYLENIKQRVISYKCGDMKTELKGFICGYFKTSSKTLVEEGKILPYLGKVREKRHLVRIDKLKYKETDWENFLYKVGLLNKSVI